MKKLIIVGQIPPPYHGQSVMIKAMADGLDGRVECEVVPMRFSREVDENGDFGVRKVIHLVQLTVQVVRLLIKYPGSVLYYPPAPPKWGTILRDCIFLACTRPLAAGTIFHFHAYGLGEFLERHRFMKWIARPLLKPDLAIILGRLCSRDAEVIEARKVEVIPYGIDISVQKSTKDAGTPRILFVGLHIESKGILDLLDTAALLKSAGAEFRIHTVGPWKNREIRRRFEEKRLALGLDEWVINRGELTGDVLFHEYTQADMLFFPTFFEFETFGLVVLEAMAYGLPVVTSDWRGPADVVENGVTGFICPVHDAEAYAGAIRQILTDEDLRWEMGRAGRKRYEERYTNEKFIDALEQAFVGLMSAKEQVAGMMDITQ